MKILEELLSTSIKTSTEEYS
jgi:Fur family transcriptional regulator, ferric uptake regulator